MKKIIFLFLFVISVMLAIVLFVFFTAQTKESGVVKVFGIKMPVNIERDQYGIPHIKAKSDEYGFFALGYVHAQDRMWQMEIQRHIAQNMKGQMRTFDRLIDFISNV